MKVNTIDEYLKYKAQGIKTLEFDKSNKEVLDFFLEDLKSDTISLLKKYGINTLNGIYSYNKNSIIPFGKHQGNLLKGIYKCDPNYLEWLLINADSFCISLETLKEMQRIKTWIAADLEFLSNSSDEYVLDIRNFDKNENGYPYSSKICEKNFIFGTTALEENVKKLNKKLDVYTVLRGSNWDNFNPISYKGTSKKIKILFK